MNQYKAQTTYFLTEGKSNLPECLRQSFKKALSTGIGVIIIYTGNGEGLELACNKYLSQTEYASIRIIGVSLPIGDVPMKALEISESRRELFRRYKVQVIRAANPFDEIQIPKIPSRSLIRRAFECFSGGMPLCLSSAIIACDAGLIKPGTHVITMSADTSLIVKAVPSSHALSGLVVREIICKPTILDVSKKEIVAAEVNAEALLSRRKSKPRSLPAPDTDNQVK